MLVGAGTVLDVAQAQAAVDAGARFFVMPHTDPELIRWAAERGIPAFPGGFTPSEILAAWRAGAAAVKLFPASVAGPVFVREMRGPLPEIPLIPVGGVNLETAPAFIAAGVLMDTFLIRTLLVPAVVTLIGRWNWFPSALSASAGAACGATAGVSCGATTGGREPPHRDTQPMRGAQ